MNIFSIRLSDTNLFFPGFLISALVALAAQFISEHYGAPAMLMALLLGIALNFLSDDPKCKSGIAFSSHTLLRIGIALLGLRVSLGIVTNLGWPIIFIVTGAVISTILFGLLISRFFGYGPRFAFLSAGSVAICGVSAAMAISAILPTDERSEERLIFTVVGVTILSTFAMIVYPILGDALGYDPNLAGIFLGGTIHDVAQAVGAGFSKSDETGDIATIVKLIRVSMLAPIIVVASIIIRRISKIELGTAKRPPLVPSFILVFMVLVIINSVQIIPEIIVNISIEISRWALLTAIAAVGMKTALKEVIHVGLPAISLLVIETAFICCFIILMLFWFF